MSERIPLNALRALVVAARHRSFKAAAAELNVTPGAVSRQVKQLEARLGCAMFERDGQGVSLTLVGRRLAHGAGQGLDRIAGAYGEVRSTHAKALSISAPPSFVQHWLMPRLDRFDAGAAEIALEASSSFVRPVWDERRIRLAVRFARGPWPNVQAETLLRDALFPVCAPSLVEHGPRRGAGQPRDRPGPARQRRAGLPVRRSIRAALAVPVCADHARHRHAAAARRPIPGMADGRGACVRILGAGHGVPVRWRADTR